MNVQHRLDGTSEEEPRRKRTWRRMRLRRSDGRIYLDRRGLAHDRVGRILLHHMKAGDPGIDLHDHPWWFVTIPLWGGYVEQRAATRDAPRWAALAEKWPDLCPRGAFEERRPFRPRVMRLDECHTIVSLRRQTAWSLVIGGPRRRDWGFYLPTGYIDEKTYDQTVRAERRDMWNEVGT